MKSLGKIGFVKDLGFYELKKSDASKNHAQNLSRDPEKCN